ncbi:hypothetical protein BCR33DRAFT_783536 [Rhizoclosmatium globosum]|uniref:Uncharacterized protein n=1 Tax=Rhizoclosmatium globosum TaxID=329046 RepID=A0A1Y2CH45_9FUNG|nr:hypothetical protein BCR33DRAFT_783536 [Rhizoclosmatium globosum]|eukprot:ORY46370.1 hypothetical protein BCR33DRAFT_783536 [Rhizoclosmatium globosum]
MPPNRRRLYPQQEQDQLLHIVEKIDQINLKLSSIQSSTSATIVTPMNVDSQESHLAFPSSLATDREMFMTIDSMELSNKDTSNGIVAELGSQTVKGIRFSSRVSANQLLSTTPIQSASAMKRARSRSLQSLSKTTAARQKDSSSRVSARESLSSTTKAGIKELNSSSRVSARTIMSESEKDRLKREDRIQQRARREKENEDDLNALPEKFKDYTNDPQTARAYWYSNLDYQKNPNDAFIPISDQEKTACITEFDSVFSPNLPLYGCAACGVRIILKKDEVVLSFPLAKLYHLSVSKLSDDNPVRIYFVLDGRFYLLHEHFLLKTCSSEPITLNTKAALCSGCHRSCLKKVPSKKDKDNKKQPSVRSVPTLSLAGGIDYGSANRALAVPTSAFEQSTRHLAAKESCVFPASAITAETVDFSIMFVGFLSRWNMVLNDANGRLQIKNGYRHVFHLDKSELVIWAKHLSDYGPPEMRGKFVLESHFDGVETLVDVLLDTANVVADPNALSMEGMASATVPGAPSASILVPEASDKEFLLGPLQPVLVETFDASSEQDESIFSKVLQAIQTEKFGEDVDETEESMDTEEDVDGMEQDIEMIEEDEDNEDDDDSFPGIDVPTSSGATPTSIFSSKPTSQSVNPLSVPSNTTPLIAKQEKKLMGDFGEMDKMMNGSMFHLFLCGWPFGTGPPTISQIRHMLNQASNVFADYPEFDFSGVGKKWRNTPAAMAELTRLLNEGVEARLENAIKNPKSKDAKLLLSEIGPLIASAGEQVWYSEERSKKAYSQMIALLRFFGPTLSYFVTCNPHMDRHLLTYRLCFPVVNNWDDPKGLTFDKIPDSYLNSVRLIDCHPFAYAKSFGLLDQGVREGLLAIPAQKDFDSLSLRPWQLRRRGTQGNTVSEFDALETAKSGSQHRHYKVCTPTLWEFILSLVHDPARNKYIGNTLRLWCEKSGFVQIATMVIGKNSPSSSAKVLGLAMVFIEPPSERSNPFACDPRNIVFQPNIPFDDAQIHTRAPNNSNVLRTFTEVGKNSYFAPTNDVMNVATLAHVNVQLIGREAMGLDAYICDYIVKGDGVELTSLLTLIQEAVEVSKSYPSNAPDSAINPHRQTARVLTRIIGNQSKVKQYQLSLLLSLLDGQNQFNMSHGTRFVWLAEPLEILEGLGATSLPADDDLSVVTEKYVTEMDSTSCYAENVDITFQRQEDGGVVPIRLSQYTNYEHRGDLLQDFNLVEFACLTETIKEKAQETAESVNVDPDAVKKPGLMLALFNHDFNKYTADFDGFQQFFDDLSAETDVVSAGRRRMIINLHEQQYLNSEHRIASRRYNSQLATPFSEYKAYLATHHGGATQSAFEGSRGPSDQPTTADDLNMLARIEKSA